MFLGPEAELLLCCARLHLARGGRERIAQLLSLKLDWALMLELAEIHGLRPLLSRHLSAVSPTALPRPVFAELWARQQALARHNQAMTSELTSILQNFEENGIPAIPYKGPALAVALFGDVSLREFCDLDILLSSEEILKARMLLESKGYHSRHSLHPSDEPAFLKSGRQYDFELFSTAKQILVELHWRTDSEFPVESTDDPSWWARLGNSRLGDDLVRSIPPRELLMILLLHGIKHHWSRLGWLVDISELVRTNPDMDWDWVLATANAMGCEKRLAVGLHMAQTLLGTVLPVEVERKLLADPSVVCLSERLRRPLFDLSDPGLTPLQSLRLNLLLYDTSPQRIRRCITLIFEPNMAHWSERTRLGPFRFLYPLLRWWGLFWKYVLRPIGKH